MKNQNENESIQCGIFNETGCEMSEGIFRPMFNLWPQLVVDILNFEPFVTRNC